MTATIRTYNAAASDWPSPRLRKGLGAVIAFALVAGASPEAAAQTAKPQWLLRADALETSDRILLLALAVKNKPGAERDRAEAARGNVERLRARLVLAAAAVRRGYADDPAVTAPLEEYRLKHLVDQFLVEKVDGPARELAGNDGLRYRSERDRLLKGLSGRAAAAFPATIDQKALAAVLQGSPGESVVARVAGGEITAAEVRSGMQRLDHPGRKGSSSEEIARIVLESLATNRSLAALAEREGLAARADFLDDVNDSRIRRLADLYAKRDIHPAVTVAPADVEARYSRDTDRLRRGTEREIFEILLSDEETAKAVAARLAAGGSFADEVRAHSVGSTKNAGGRLGFLQEKQTIPELDGVISALSEKEVSAPVRTSFGWHILRCERVVTGRVPAFEEVRAGLEAEEMAERRAAAVRERVSVLEGEIKVGFNELRYQEIVKGQVR